MRARPPGPPPLADAPARRPKLCLAASGGGHVRQILDLEPVWRDRARVFVTEDTALSRSIARDQPTRFVPHFALGQARLGAPVRMIGLALASIARSAAIVWRERPDIVITTGAGSQVFVVAFARLRGARIVLIDSFARFDRPSAFARLAGWLAEVRIAQSPVAAQAWPGALLFDPYRGLDGPRPAKEALLFATVGATLPFERLVRLVAGAKAQGLLPERVVLQTGTETPPIEGIETVATLPFDEVTALLDRADLVVCHGGTGSLITALRAGCRTIAVPRRFALGEHYDDHQAEITGAFAARGLIAVADDEASFAAALATVRGREPVRATTDPGALIAFLDDWIAAWPDRRAAAALVAQAKTAAPLQ